MSILLFVIAAMIAFGVYGLATLAFPSRAASAGLHRTLNPDRRHLSWDDRLPLPAVALLEPRVKISEDKVTGVEQDLKDANIALTPKEYLLLPWVKGAPFWILGLLFCFTSAFYGLCLMAAGVLIFWDSRTRAARAVKKRRYNILAEMPAFVAHVLHASNPPVLVSIIGSYLPTAGKTLKAELLHLLADMNSITSDTQGSHEAALGRFSSRIRVDMVTRVTLGLIALDRGEEFRPIFQGLLNELNSWRKAQKERIAAKRPNETFLAIVLLFMGIGAAIFVAVALYFQQSVAGLFTA